MKSDLYRVLIFSGDEHLTQELAGRLRDLFHGFPVEMDFEPSARRLATTFREKLHDLVILAAGGADADMPQAILQLQGVSGSVRILYLGVSPLGEGYQGVDSFPLPIVQWNAVLGLIGEMVPEHLAERYHLRKIENPLRRALERHAHELVGKDRDREVAKTNPSKSEKLEGFLLAPEVWRQAMHSKAGTPEAVKSVGRNESRIRHSPSETSADLGAGPHSWSRELQRKSLRTEAALLAGILVITTLVQVFYDPEGPEYWIGIKSVLKLISAASIFGFFASRGLEQALLRRTDPKESTESQ